MYNKGMIDAKMKTYMMPSNPHAGKVKGNPKVHKKGTPMRIIVSSINHPTEKIAEVAEKELEEWVEKLPSYMYVKRHNRLSDEIGKVEKFNTK